MVDMSALAKWHKSLAEEVSKDYMQDLQRFLESERQEHMLYPPEEYCFAALESCSFSDVRVVILGQDPYHGEGQAHGLSFSVPGGVKNPPSLRNIFKELERDIGGSCLQSGNLSNWSKQGVLLLNSTLTVRKGAAGSHQKKGWEILTDRIISLLANQREGLVFMLWGSYAHKKAAKVDASRHLVLKSVHPSPLSAHRGFLGCGHFSAANAYIEAQGGKNIRW